MKVSPVVKNASWIIVCRVIQAILSLVISTLTARYLGPSNYGLINYASAVVAFMIPIMQLGFRNTLVQEFVKYPESEGQTLGTAMFLNVMASCMSVIGVVAFVSIANRGETDTIIVCFLYSLNLIFQALEMSQYWFQAKLLSKYMASVSVIAYAVVSLYKIYLLTSGKNVYWFAISQALDYLIIAVALLVIYKKVGTQPLSISRTAAKRMLGVSKHYIVSSMMVTVFGYIGNIFLKLLIDEAAVGFYTAAVSCANMTTFVFGAIIDSLRPGILTEKERNPVAYEHKIKQLYAVIIFLTVAQAVVITLLAGVIVKVLFGAEYTQTVWPLRIYIWQTIFAQLGTVRNIWILAENKQKYLWIINSSGAAVSIALNFAFIPLFGVVGAAVAALLTQIFTNVILGFIMKPIRYNNVLMWRGCDLRLVTAYVKQFLKKAPKA